MSGVAGHDVPGSRGTLLLVLSQDLCRFFPRVSTEGKGSAARAISHLARWVAPTQATVATEKKTLTRSEGVAGYGPIPGYHGED